MFGIPFEFFLFAATLLCVALFHNHTLYVALGGMFAIALYKLGFSDFGGVAGFAGLTQLLAHEWVIITNLLGLLLGFALLADHFERSELPNLLPRYLADDWKGGFMLLVLIFVMSAFLDNIAAAMIGGTMAGAVFKKRVHIGYLAAIVAASNAGGAGSVVGDTTTTMMWIAGVKPGVVFEAFIASAVALCIFGTIAAKQQHAYQPIQKDAPANAHVDWSRLAVCLVILLSAIGINIFFNTTNPAVLDKFPAMGAAVWVAIFATALWRKPTWGLMPSAFKGSVFLLALVMCAAMMPVKALPTPTPLSTMGLGFVSAVFDNIPLTALALRQGGYDWGFLAFAVGFGGSMLWFGSSAGVALSNMYPEAKSVGAWLKAGWHIALAYVVGYAVLWVALGWNPTPIK